VLPAARAKIAERSASGLDFDDAALLLRLGQLKHEAMPALACPWRRQFTHVVIDEAQDLSLVEIAVLIEAADEGRSVTIAGDPAQTLYRSEPVDFDALLARLTGAGASRLDTLPVGHRSSAPILDLALRALGRSDPALLARTRDGAPVVWLEGDRATVDALVAELRAFRDRRPTALVAVLCKQKRDADRWFERLGPALPDVRRGDRDGFTFEPGVVVTNAHQVKGLEFDGVVVVDPRAYGEADRRLLHVAITRAADRLWVFAPEGRGVIA
jgi:DNA helicase II / ATP-dependent DNA helicase PcrA